PDNPVIVMEKEGKQEEEDEKDVEAEKKENIVRENYYGYILQILTRISLDADNTIDNKINMDKVANLVSGLENILTHHPALLKKLADVYRFRTYPNIDTLLSKFHAHAINTKLPSLHSLEKDVDEFDKDPLFIRDNKIEKGGKVKTRADILKE